MRFKILKDGNEFYVRFFGKDINVLYALYGKENVKKSNDDLRPIGKVTYLTDGSTLMFEK